MEKKEPLLERHIYKIGDAEFILHHDYTWDEYEWLENFMKKIQESLSTMQNITREEATKFLSIVLRYKDGSECAGFNFGACRKEMTSQIVTDFFLTYALLQLSIQEFSKLSPKEKNELLMSLET